MLTHSALGYSLVVPAARLAYCLSADWDGAHEQTHLLPGTACGPTGRAGRALGAQLPPNVAWTPVAALPPFQEQLLRSANAPRDLRLGAFALDLLRSRPARVALQRLLGLQRRAARTKG